MSVRARGGGKKIGGSYQQLCFQHRPEVGSDWLERRGDVTPWTGQERTTGKCAR